MNNTHYRPEQLHHLLSKAQSLYFVGIGGISMVSLAEIAHRRGYRVGGSDEQPSDLTNRLSALGIVVYDSQKAENISAFHPDIAVYTLAIGEDNPEIVFAKENNIPLVSRADLLGVLMLSYQNRIGICGMHGKSTATAMLASVYGEDATVLCGAKMMQYGKMTYHIGQKPKDFIFEACEYRDSFLDFFPTTAVVLNLGMDHVDYFHSMSEIYHSFRTFAKKAELLIYNGDDSHCVTAFSDLEMPKITFGFGENNDVVGEKIGENVLRVKKCDKLLGDVTLPLPGEHYCYDALAVIATADCDFAKIRSGLSCYPGIARRMEYKGTVNGAVVYDDYAHHPDEIRATLKTARKLTKKKIRVAFQSHTYSRTEGLLNQFGEALRLADSVYICDIYPARETDTRGMSAEVLARAVGEKATVVHNRFDCVRQMLGEAQEGDLCLVMGAGDIGSVWETICNDGND